MIPANATASGLLLFLCSHSCDIKTSLGKPAIDFKAILCTCIDTEGFMWLHAAGQSSLFTLSANNAVVQLLNRGGPRVLESQVLARATPPHHDVGGWLQKQCQRCQNAHGDDSEDGAAMAHCCRNASSESYGSITSVWQHRSGMKACDVGNCKCCCLHQCWQRVLVRVSTAVPCLKVAGKGSCRIWL